MFLSTLIGSNTVAVFFLHYKSWRRWHINSSIENPVFVGMKGVILSYKYPLSIEVSVSLGNTPGGNSIDSLFE